MSDDRLQELIRSSTPRPATPVDVESLWRRGQRRNRRRRAGVTGALASVLVVSVVATAAALGGGSDERVRTGETASSGSVESPASQEQEPFEWGSQDHLLALADCVRAKGFDPIVDLEDGRIEVHVPPKDDPVPVCEQELEDQGVVESRGPSVGEPGVFDAEARRQEDEARRQAEAQQRRATTGQSADGANDAVVVDEELVARWPSFYESYAAINDCLANAGFRAYETPTVEDHLGGDPGWWHPYDALFGRPASPHPGEPGLDIRSEGEPGKDGQDAFEMAEQTCSQDISD